MTRLVYFFLVFVQVLPSFGHKCEYETNFYFRSTKTCEDLAFEGVYTTKDITGMDACSVSVENYCLANVATYTQGAAQCASKGARLCTLEEVSEGYDNWLDEPDCVNGQKVWVSDYGTLIGNERQVVRIIAKGVGVTTPLNVSMDTTANVYCCADAEVSPKPFCKPCKAKNSVRQFIGAGTAIACGCQDGFDPVYSDDPDTNGKPMECVDSRPIVEALSSCSDGEYAVGTSSLCGDLGSDFHDLGNTGLCASVNQTYSGPSCEIQTENSWNDAQALCTAANARLPTSWELRTDEINHGVKPLVHECTGLNWVYTSTPCGDDRYVVQHLKYPKRRLCVGRMETHRYQTVCMASQTDLVQCMEAPHASEAPSGSTTYTCPGGYSSASRYLGTCKETPAPTMAPTTGAPTTPVPTTACTVNQFRRDRSDLPPDEVLNGPTKDSYGSRWVFAHQPLESDACPTAKTFEQARTICENNGARLCTVGELENREAKLFNVGSNGCGNNVNRVWSSTPCCTSEGTCDVAKVYTALGDGRYRGCDDTAGTFQVRCCVDRIPSYLISNTCIDCPDHSSSPGTGERTSCVCDENYWGADGGTCHPIELV